MKVRLLYFLRSLFSLFSIFLSGFLIGWVFLSSILLSVSLYSYSTVSTLKVSALLELSLIGLGLITSKRMRRDFTGLTRFAFRSREHIPF